LENFIILRSTLIERLDVISAPRRAVSGTRTRYHSSEWTDPEIDRNWRRRRRDWTNLQEHRPATQTSGKWHV